MFDLDIGDLSLEEDEDSPPPTKAKGRVGKAVREPPTTSKRKRTAALMDDDADTAFKGFWRAEEDEDVMLQIYS